MVKNSHFKIAMGFFGKIWENISISLPRTIPAVSLNLLTCTMLEIHSWCVVLQVFTDVGGQGFLHIVLQVLQHILIHQIFTSSLLMRNLSPIWRSPWVLSMPHNDASWVRRHWYCFWHSSTATAAIWPGSLTSPVTLILDFRGQILK